jgi:hypothetical protein
MAMDVNANLESGNVCEISAEELTVVSGGMIDLHQDGPHPGEQTPGRLVSVIGYRTIGDVGL